MVEMKHQGVSSEGLPVTMYTIVNAKGSTVSLIDDGPYLCEAVLSNQKKENLETYNAQLSGEKRFLVEKISKEGLTFISDDGRETIDIALDEESNIVIQRNKKEA
ncbi:MAG: hypothetical protein IJ091_02295 [Oscillospiraceae bacterium]|nr:hypothetical protein [Oscillospiraceae bacterium]